MRSKWRLRSQWWRCGKEFQHNTAKIIYIDHPQIDSTLKFGYKRATEYKKKNIKTAISAIKGQ